MPTIWLLVAAVIHLGSSQPYYQQQYQYQQYNPQYYPPIQQPQQWPVQNFQFQLQPPIYPGQQQQQQPQPIFTAQQRPPVQQVTPEQLQYLQQTDPTRKARRYIASYWDPQKQQTVYYERLEPQQGQPAVFFQQQQGFQQQQQQPFQQGFPVIQQQQQQPQTFIGQQQQPFSRGFPQNQPANRQLLARQPPQTLNHQAPPRQQPARQLLKTDQQGFPDPNRQVNFRPNPSHSQRPPAPQNALTAPRPPGKFVPYPQDIFQPLDTRLTPPPPPPAEVLVSGGSGTQVEHSSIEEIPAEESRRQPNLHQTPHKQQPQQPPQHQKKVDQKRPTTTTNSGTPRKPSASHVSVPVAPRPVSALEESFEERADDANGIFLQCCKKRRVDKRCEVKCNFDTMNKKMLTAMFLGTDPCPQSYGRDLLSCAAQDSDHTQCCIEKGVHETSAGKKCLGFCNMAPDNTFQADVSMLPCWAVLNDIKGCFRENLEDSL